MTRICNFPISKTRRCKQPMADGRPNCGRHSTDLSADQLGQNPTVCKKGGELHVWAGEPDGLYCLVHGDPAYRALCQVAGETLPCCLKDDIEWKDEYGNLHRDDGPAMIHADGAQYWYQHGKLHRDGGPAIIWSGGMQSWWQYDELHREDGPAVIWRDGEQEWYQHDRRHREDGPAVITPGGMQSWWQDGKMHRDDGPAVIEVDGTQHWYWHGEKVTEREHAELRAQSQGV